MAKTLEADLLKLEQVKQPEDGSLVGRVMSVHCCVLDALTENLLHWSPGQGMLLRDAHTH